MHRFGFRMARQAAPTAAAALSLRRSAAALIPSSAACCVSSAHTACQASAFLHISKRFSSNVTGTTNNGTATSTLPPAPVEDAYVDGSTDHAAPISTNATGLSDADKEIVRQALELEQKVRAERAIQDKALAERAAAEGKEKWQLEKEIAESGDLIKDKQRKDQMGGQGIGTKSGDMMAIFTCNVCEHRSAKRFSKHCYTQGIVIVQCPNCTSRHLLADNMGWFEDAKKNIEDILAERGEEVVRLNAGIYIESISAETVNATGSDLGKGAA